ncbi:MAG TPA: 30S ribosomal protein S16 [Candidatus Moranbacteria bacterium]|nr:30S ribosomal protein S16 [Candidatus Moranbacteria bacterium]
MLTIRFARVGKVNKAQYKVVLQEKTVAPGGRHVEILGSYDPHSKQAVLKDERIKYWIEKGAQLSDTVHNLFASKGLIAEKKRPVKMPKKVEEAKPEEAKTEAPVAENKPVEEVKLETKVEAPVAEVKPEEPEAEEVKKRRS